MLDRLLRRRGRGRSGSGAVGPARTGEPFPWRGTLLPLLAFAALALAVATGTPAALGQLDARLSESVRAPTSGALDAAALVATLFGDFPLTVALMLALVALLFAFGRVALALHAAWLFFLTKLAVAATKLALGRTRPLALYEGGDAYAFPSGHATSAAVLLVVVAALFLARRTVRAATALRTPAVATDRAGARDRHGTALVVLLAVVALAVALSRVRLGAHWPSDVVAGLALAFALARPFVWHARRGPPLPNALPRLALALLVTAYLGYAAYALSSEATRYGDAAADASRPSSPRIEAMPASGPRASSQNSAGQPTAAATNGVACTVRIVSAKPSAVCNDIRLPASSGGA